MQQFIKNNKKLIFRYLAAGLWNTLFAWLIFAVIWYAGESFLPLWILAIISHFFATTQAFLVQRRWVFQSTAEELINQYWRFQWVYLGLLGIGLFMLEALIAQGVHPLLAQGAVMATQALSGFTLGRSFTFNDKVFSLKKLWENILENFRKNSVPWLIFILSLFLFYENLSKPFYINLDHQGHDFSLAATYLLEGKFWLQSNGFISGLFNPPWFTPAWCAGSAFFADPQAAFYSPVQWLALVLDPFIATQVATLIFAALAFWGSYALAKHIFQWSLSAATVFAVLGIANTFMPLRSALGELGYQPVYLWVLLVLSLCWPPKGAHLGSSLAGPSLAITLILTAWLQFGFAGMMVPTFLGAMLLCLVLIISGRAQFKLVVLRAIIGGLLAIVLNSSKLYEASSLMRNFPRDFYAMPGFPSLYDALVASVMALILPSEWTADFGMRRLTGVQFSVLPHEWALEFGWGAFAMTVLAALALLVVSHKRKSEKNPEQYAVVVSCYSKVQRTLLWLCVAMLAILPPLLLWNHGPVRDSLKQIPILNSAAWPMRWIIIYLPLCQWLLAWPVQQLVSKLPNRYHLSSLIIMSTMVWLGPLTSPKDYYVDPNFQAYSPKPVLYAYQQSHRTGQPIPIDRVVADSKISLTMNRNDAMIWGASQGFCYNPLYGYRLENFPQINRLQTGPALMQDHNGQSLIYNPACLVHPESNSCRPGDGFFLDNPEQRVAAEKFLARKPFHWSRPWLGIVLSWVSQIMFWIIATLLTIFIWQALLRKSMPAVK